MAIAVAVGRGIGHFLTLRTAIEVRLSIINKAGFAHHAPLSGSRLAEIVRAGLQSVPRGQEEAADSLGLSWAQTIGLVILPQALRAVIPSFVNLAIGIFLDTTLVIGLFDFLNTARVAAADPKWLGYYNEAFAFTALVYFTFCLAGSRYSTWLEVKLRAARANF